VFWTVAVVLGLLPALLVCLWASLKLFYYAKLGEFSFRKVGIVTLFLEFLASLRTKIEKIHIPI